jgi:hypothetical protein
MLSLTKDTVDDSATVRVVTVVTLIFLPASFVAVSSSSMTFAGIKTNVYLVPVWDELFHISNF